MELELGPFDPALHIRSRDHYEAVRREAQLIAMQPDAPPARFAQLVERLRRQFPPSPVDEVADQAYLAGEPTFVARFALPDELAAAALEACDELEALLEELDRWAATELQLLEAPPDVRRYRTAYLAQARAQLQRSTATGRYGGDADERLG
jgi:hypothetical protein